MKYVKIIWTFKWKRHLRFESFPIVFYNVNISLTCPIFFETRSRCMYKTFLFYLPRFPLSNVTLSPRRANERVVVPWPVYLVFAG